MNLYKILFEHFSQKDSAIGIKCFLIAENDEQVYEWLKSDPRLGEDWITTCYEDWEDEEEGFKDRIIACKGQIFDDDYCPTNLYYGVTAYGWELICDSSIIDLTVLKDYGLLYNIEVKK